MDKGKITWAPYTKGVYGVPQLLQEILTCIFLSIQCIEGIIRHGLAKKIKYRYGMLLGILCKNVKRILTSKGARIHQIKFCEFKWPEIPGYFLTCEC